MSPVARALPLVLAVVVAVGFAWGAFAGAEGLDPVYLLWRGLSVGSVASVGFGLAPAIHGRSGIRIALRTPSKRRVVA